VLEQYKQLNIDAKERNKRKKILIDIVMLRVGNVVWILNRGSHRESNRASRCLNQGSQRELNQAWRSFCLDNQISL
jgi:hypothetical protein